MTKIFLTLAMVFSLMLTPLAHAEGWDCQDGVISDVAKLVIKKDFSQEHDSGKAQKSVHHCCSHTIWDRVASKMLDIMPSATNAIIPATDDAIASIAFGPPLEPPSHA